MEPVRMSLMAPAKINIFLRVTGRRSDGYHYLETLMQKVSLFDELMLTTRTEGIQLTCNGGTVPAGAENLVWRAADLFLRTTGERRSGKHSGVSIALTKKIPVAAGLGGGSSDAAATLRGLNTLCGNICTAGELAAMGLQLGADVPFFLADEPAALATGIGEILQPVAPLHGYTILLVNPGFPVSTRWVYQTFALTGKINASNLSTSQEEDIDLSLPEVSPPGKEVPVTLKNDLEAVTLAQYPEIGQLKNALLRAGAVGALMSGSGPTVFGLFRDVQRAEECCASMRGRFPQTFMVTPVGKKTAM